VADFFDAGGLRRKRWRSILPRARKAFDQRKAALPRRPPAHGAYTESDEIFAN
jgi:hypothetical protein